MPPDEHHARTTEGVQTRSVWRVASGQSISSLRCYPSSKKSPIITTDMFVGVSIQGSSNDDGSAHVRILPLHLDSLVGLRRFQPCAPAAGSYLFPYLCQSPSSFPVPVAHRQSSALPLSALFLRILQRTGVDHDHNVECVVF